MARIPGRPRAEVNREEAYLVGLLVGGLHEGSEAVARSLGATQSGSETAAAVSTTDLNTLVAGWSRFVDEGGPMSFLAGVYETTRERLTRSISRAARVPLDAVPRTSTVAQEAYLARARNRLRGIGDDLWVRARESLVEGIRQGESVKELRDRVREAATLTEARADAVARTEVQDAVVGSEYDEFRATGLVATKEWLATNDTRTRETHRAVDGTTIPLTEVFTVGGFPMRRPLDPTGPPDEIINCRCTLIYDVADDELQNLIAAAEPPTNDGVMIALVPTEQDIVRLTVDPDIDGAEKSENIHLTLWFLGNVADYTSDHREGLVNHVRTALENLHTGPITKTAFGVNHWNVLTNNPSWVLAVGDDREDHETVSLGDVRQAVSPHRYVEVSDLEIPTQHSPWVPHVCLVYTGDPLIASVMSERLGPITFDRVRVAFGTDVTDISLRHPDTVAPDLSPGADEE